MSIYQTPTGKWRVQVGSGKHRKTKVFTNKRDAERYRAITEPVEGQDQTTWQDLADNYFVSTKYLYDKSQNTRPVEVRASKPVLAHFGKKLVVTTDDRAVEEYKELRIKTISPRTKKRLSGNTVRLELDFLAILAKIAIRNRIITDTPLRLVEKPKCEEKEIRISNFDLSVIFETVSVLGPDEPKAIHYYYYFILYQIGCRPSELAGLTINNVNFEKKQFRFYRTKNTKSRTVPVPTGKFELIVEWFNRKDRPKDCPYIFPSVHRKTGEWIPFGFSNSWKGIRRKIGHLINPEISPHAFRHERISRWFEDTTMNEGQIMELSGHLTSAALNRYRHIRAETFRDEIEKLDIRDEKRIIDSFNENYKDGRPTERKEAVDGWGNTKDSSKKSIDMP